MVRAPGTHRGQPVDAARLNAPFLVEPPRDPVAPWPFLVVPGYTPRRGWRTGTLHPRAIERLARARRDLDARLAPAVIVTGGAVHSPDNEAVLMREWLLAAGVEARRVLVEPCARHSTTNLRNVGRMLLERGCAEALVVTSDGAAGQARYFGFPWISTFHLRCLHELGYRVGELTWLGPMHVRFRPSRAVLLPSRHEARSRENTRTTFSRLGR